MREAEPHEPPSWLNTGGKYIVSALFTWSGRVAVTPLVLTTLRGMSSELSVRVTGA